MILSSSLWTNEFVSTSVRRTTTNKFVCEGCRISVYGYNSFISFLSIIIYVYQKDSTCYLRWEPVCPISNPQCLTDIQRGRSKSLGDLLKTELWFTALEWLQCIHHLCSSTVVTKAWHLSTISLGQPAPLTTSKCKWDHHWSQLGLSWHHSFPIIAPHIL